uniref:Kazal-like domain-containing protein n=1 Tax=Physcomitrium patens TaxID=3218 RepID=A0A2K1JQZ9_PHYPA|nr:hypothetical protein PHYPA_016344 [Physcomitrium patens]
MAALGRGPRCFEALLLLLSVVVFHCGVVIQARTEENSFVVSQHGGGGGGGDGSVNLVTRGASPCRSGAELRPEESLIRSVVSKAAADGANNVLIEPCILQTTKSCPVKCVRTDPVCGVDKVTYWCGAADAKCAGVEVAHDGSCNLWELGTATSSTTALYALHSLQLNRMFCLVIAGLFVALRVV